MKQFPRNDTMKVLISSRSFGKSDTDALELLQNEKLEPILNPYGRKMNEAEIADMITDVVGVIAGTELLSQKVLTEAPMLKVISRYGIGLDNIDLQSAHKHGILVYNTPNTPALAVAELTLSLILNLLKKIGKVDRLLRTDEWKPDMGNLLTHKTVGIIGLGRIGKKVIKLLQPFNPALLAYDVQPDKQYAKQNNIKLVTLPELLTQSDIITIHCPLIPETHHLIGEKELSLMKPTTLIINTARGGIIDEHALYVFVKQGKIAGAALDVFEHEPNTGKLKELENVILTPHIATYTQETRKQMELEAVQNLIKGLREVKML